MKDRSPSPEYSILVTRDGTGFVASVPELCIAERGATPQEALSAALQAEEEARKSLEEGGYPLPPSGPPADPFPAITRVVKRYFPFFAKVAVGYVLVLCMTGIILTLAYPGARSRAVQYVTSHHAAADVHKVLSKLGIDVCLKNH